MAGIEGVQLFGVRSKLGGHHGLRRLRQEDVLAGRILRGLWLGLQSERCDVLAMCYLRFVFLLNFRQSFACAYPVSKGLCQSSKDQGLDLRFSLTNFLTMKNTQAYGCITSKPLMSSPAV